ncbi:MAG: acyloxyacyl hydrolase [Bosea sp.]|uniref:acyloxyacyl hydrolase n=1 Tax=Bosea sp. (in: a-proteobacteria) TaxID=1871050 RepID=UPI001ACBDA69|nr:acyloxyacyl hydrolase [Bosea sp. (in: a-proteobacteria)]MBN9453129.1 acyloxyacyl hydrolase [Bosea sp. (in: a-proteobacteria)]
MVRVALLPLAVCLAIPAASAQTRSLSGSVSSYAPATEAPAPAWEARIGAGLANPGGRESGLPNLSADLLSPRIVPLSDRIAAAFIPRFNLGASVNLNGTRYAYAGATWSFDVTRDIFVEASLAAALNDGKTGPIVPENRLALGCNTGTREAAALGFRLSDRWSLVTTLEHFSTVGCSDKTGSTGRGPANIGARLGYTF